MDQLSLYFQASLTRVWYPKGQTPIVRVSPQRDHLHFYGALNLVTGQELALSMSALSAESTCHFLCHLLDCWPIHPSLLLMDRAPWHTARTVQDFIAHQPRLQVAYFPPACPDLNPQEHVWKLARQEITHHHAYPNFPALCQAFRHFLDCTFFQFDWVIHRIPPVLRQFVLGCP
jgi:transposase